MNRKDIAIATITWARNDKEEQLLRESLQQLAQLHIPVFIADGGSNESFLEFLKSFPHFTVLTAMAKGVWAQAKTSLLAAYNTTASFIFYTEPDKRDFFVNFLPELLDKAAVDEKTGVLLASRSATGFASFPLFQQMTETTINRCCAEVMGKSVDYTYGPFLLNRNLVLYISQVQEDIGWGWRPYLFGVAHRLGYAIEAFEKDLLCPPEQQDDNKGERLYRMRQLSQNIQGLVLSQTVRL